MARVLYHPYDPTLNTHDIEALQDVDEYYPDIVETLSHLTEPKIFITGWLIMPHIHLTSQLTFKGLLIQELKKQNAKVYVLWNTNYNGAPYPKLRNIAKRLHRDVTKAAKVDAGDFKIILSTNMEFDPPALVWTVDQALEFNRWLHRDNPDAPVPTPIRQWAQDLWLRQFPNNPEDYRNLAVLTLGSHHQKTFTILGRSTANSQLEIHAYCGGSDFSSGPAGYHKSSRRYNGGKWWHDAAMRVRGHHALSVLENFVERWNQDLAGVVNETTLSYGVSISNMDQLDAGSLSSGIMEDSSGDNVVFARRTMPLGGVDWPGGRERVNETLETYREWIPRAKNRIIIINQYVRHLEVAALLEEKLDSDPNIRLTIVMPSYSEEMGSRLDLIKIRQNHGARDATDAERSAAMTKAQSKSFTIDPINKLTLYLQSRSLANLIQNPKTRVWIPLPILGGRIRGTPYIHTKMILVDDAILMIGSANINGRSLDGLADSEINLMLTDNSEIQRIRDTHQWHLEPEGEWSEDYTGSWYQKHNLIRYTQYHWLIDQEYGRFPVGRAQFLDYLDKFQTDGRVDQISLQFDRTQVEALLDAAPVDLTDLDFGFWLTTLAHHLI